MLIFFVFDAEDGLFSLTSLRDSPIPLYFWLIMSILGLDHVMDVVTLLFFLE